MNLARSSATSAFTAAVAIALSGIGALAGTSAGAGQSEEVERGDGVWQGLELRTMGGEQLGPEDLLGRVVLLDFWATWCAPCLEELPNLRRIHGELSEQGVLVIGVAMDQTSDRAELRSWLRRNGVDWPQIWDNRGLDGDLALRFGVEAVPRTVVVDHAGRMVAVDLRGEALYTVLRDLTSDP